jgi:hypothetical protein
MDEASILKVENRIRSLVMDLISPTARRSTDAADLLAELSHKFENVENKINDIEIIQTKTLTRLSYLDEFNRRLMEFSANQSLIESRMNKDRLENQTIYHNLTEKNIEIKEEVSVLEHQGQSMKIDIGGLSHNLINTKYEFEQKIAGFKDEYRTKLTDFEDRVVRLEVETENVIKKIKKMTKESLDLNTKSQFTARVCEEHKDKLKQMEARIETNKNESKNHFEINRMTGIKLNTDLSRLEKLISGTKSALKNFEEKEHKNRLKLTQPLYNLLTDIHQLRILAQYDLQRLFSEDSKDCDVKTLISSIKTKAEDIMKIEVPRPLSSSSSDAPKKKRRRRTAAKNSIQTGLLKPAKDSYNQSDLISSKQRKESFQNNVELSSITPVLSIKPKKRKDSDSSYSSSGSEIPYVEPVDYTPIINKVKEELEKIISGHVQALNELHYTHYQELKDLIDKSRQDLESKLNSFHEYNTSQFIESNKHLHDVEILTQQVVYECSSQLNNRKRENNDFSFELKSLQGKIEEINKKHSESVENVESFGKKLEKVVEYCYLENTLQTQDEVDRESIVLMGYKDSKTFQNHKKLVKPVISIDKQCLSCTGQSSLVLNAFKIACLAYTPSPVFFLNEKHTRRELLDLQNKLLAELGPKPGEFSLFDKKQARAVSTTMKNWRPLSVPSPQFSPHSDFPDAELPRILRKSINL